jgi:hypothetical protein
MLCLDSNIGVFEWLFVLPQFKMEWLELCLCTMAQEMRW